MKRILITAVIAIFALCSCTPKADKAAAVAGDFLTSFFNMDYAAAAGYCTSDIADMLRDTIAAGDYPSEEIRAKVVEASKKTSFKIVSSEVEEETGAVIIGYEIRPYGAVGEGSIPHTMRLEKIDGSWKIVALE
ncbi:MAG: hypothetical protein II963_00075 [Bacteroidales bacterium]|nr:hypothetical protein [Bacteroidales bacterium]